VLLGVKPELVGDFKRVADSEGWSLDFGFVILMVCKGSGAA
jgi:hypothetical protein